MIGNTKSVQNDASPSVAAVAAGPASLPANAYVVRRTNLRVADAYYEEIYVKKTVSMGSARHIAPVNVTQGTEMKVANVYHHVQIHASTVNVMDQTNAYVMLATNTSIRQFASRYVIHAPTEIVLDLIIVDVMKVMLWLMVRVPLYAINLV